MDKQNYGNIGVLDIRNATEKTVSQINFGNIGVVIHNRETSVLLNNLSSGNIGGTVEVEGEFKFITGEISLNKQNNNSGEFRGNILLTGKMIIGNDVTPEDIEKQLGSLLMIGTVVTPKSLQTSIQKKIINFTGKIESYPDGFHVRSGLRLSNEILKSLNDNSNIAVLGAIKAIDEIDEDLFRKKISSIYLTGKIFGYEKNVGLINSVLHEESNANIDLVEDGYRVLEQNVLLERSTLEAWENHKLFCQANVEIKADVDVDLFRNKISALKVKGKIYCPDNIKALVNEKCGGVATNIITYKDNLLKIDDEYVLSPSTLKFLKGLITLVNLGELSIQKDVEAEALFDKFEKVYNYGEIMLHGDQMGAIQAKISENHGDIVDVDQKKSEARTGIGNIGYLKL